MGNKSNAYFRNIVLGVVLLVGFVIIGVAFRFLIYPMFESDLVDATSGNSRYTETVRLRLDSFSGYAPLRSEAFEADLRKQGIKLEIYDDEADYGDRIRALKRGRADMGVFTIDGYLAAGQELGAFPGTIVAIVDETVGADAIVAFQDDVPTLSALDDSRARVVLTPASPSEFLARVAISEFGLSDLTTRWTHADGAKDVVKRMKKHERGSKVAYVLWEPHVSQALELPGTHVLFDSGQVTGYVVDALVVDRRFLLEKPKVVRAFVEAYFRTVYELEQSGKMAELIASDARASGDALSSAQVDKVVAGVRWKNTLENYAHFGLLPADRTGGVVHVEDAIANISHVLVQTSAVASDPTAGKPEDLFYPGLMAELQADSFHPKEGMGTGDLDAIRATEALRPLTQAEWEQLLPVGAMQAKPIQFGRAKATIHRQGQRDLDELGRRLRALPRYYLTITGHARAEGDPAANLQLAKDRAESVRTHLVSAGVPPERLRSRGAAPIAGGAEAQEVRFELGQLAY